MKPLAAFFRARSLRAAALPLAAVLALVSPDARGADAARPAAPSSHPATAPVLLPVAKLSAIGARAYRYRLAPGKPLRDYNIEQQAEIVRHLFLARCGEPETGAPPRLELEALWARR